MDKDETHALQRDELAARLRREGAQDLAEPLEKCGELVPLMCTSCGNDHETEFSCHKRWCPSCAPKLAAARTQKWGAAISQLQWPLFIALTIPNSENPDSLRVLRSAWAKFRRRKLIREKVKGGVAGFEITNKGNGWHPHLHAVADCRWLSLHIPEPKGTDSAAVKKEKCRLAQVELSSLWADQLGEPGSVVWVSRVTGGNIAKEVLKYACKGSELLDSPDPIVPMLRVLQQTRTMSGWGSLFPLPSPDEDLNPGLTCESCGQTKTYMPEHLVHYMWR